MTTQSTQWTICIVLLTLDIIICSPLQFISLIKFIRFFNNINYTRHPFLSKVYPQITICTCIISIICILVWHPLRIILSYAPIEFPIIVHHFTHHSFIIIFQLWVVLLSSRYWLMQYQLKASNSNINKRWKSHIDPDIIKKDFWLSHKSLGNKSYILKIAVVIFIFNVIVHSCCIHVFPGLLDRRAWLQFNILLWTYPGIIGVTFYCKSPKIMNNIFYLKYELASGLTMFMVTFPICIAITSYLSYHGSADDIDYIYTAAYNATFAIATTGYMLLSSNWMLRKYRLYISNKGSFNLPESESNTNRILTLRDVLCDQQYVELFIQYLCGQWKMNVILCFIEMVQFKHVVDSSAHRNMIRNVI